MPSVRYGLGFVPGRASGCAGETTSACYNAAATHAAYSARVSHAVEDHLVGVAQKRAEAAGLNMIRDAQQKPASCDVVRA